MSGLINYLNLTFFLLDIFDFDRFQSIELLSLALLSYKEYTIMKKLPAIILNAK